MRRLIALAVGVLVSGLSMPAVAQVPDARGFYNYDATGGENPQSGAITTTPFTIGDAFTTITVLGQSQPSISVVSTPGAPSRQSGGNAGFGYFFRFQAADQAAYDALFTANGNVNFAGISTITDSDAGSGREGFFSSGRTTLDIRATGAPIRSLEYLCGNFRNDTDGCGTQAFSENIGVSSFADAETLSFFGSVFLSAWTENGGDGIQVDRSSAFIDPIITLNVQGVDLSKYRLQLSNGIGNGGLVAGVPEPASWAMMIIGFGMAGGALRWRTAAKAALA